MKARTLTAAAVALTLLATPSQANTCEGLATIAEGIMTMRQDGVPISEATTIIASIGGPHEKVAHVLIAEAYATPRYIAQGVQAAAIRSFRNHVENTCLGA